MEITHSACLCMGFCGQLHFYYASGRFAGILLPPWICSALKRAFRKLWESYPLLCRDRALLCLSPCCNDIQLQESLEKDSGDQHSIGAYSSTPTRRDDSLKARDSFKQIFVCCGFCLHVVLDTLVDHHHPNALQHH